MKRLASATALVLASGLLAACGVPTESEPNHINPRDVPFDLLDKLPRASGTSTTSVPPAAATTSTAERRR